MYDIIIELPLYTNIADQESTTDKTLKHAYFSF